MTILATTKLEAVNTMLSAIGEAPVSSITGNATADVAMAIAILDEVDKQVQSVGWHFNTEFDVVLTPNVSNEIEVPTNIIRIDVTRANAPTKDITQRGSKLYDLVEHSYTFTAQVKCDVVYLLAFTDLPEAARKYITARAARVFQDRVLGAREHHQYNLRDEQLALADLRRHEGLTGDYTYLDNLPHVLDRVYPRPRSS